MRHLLRSGTRYLLLSGLSFVLTTGLTVLFHEIFGCRAELAVALAYVLVMINNFLCFRYFVFESHQAPFVKQVTHFVLSSAGFRGSEFMAFLLFHTWLGLPYLPVLVTILFLSTLAKFAFYGGVVFRKPREGAPKQTPPGKGTDSMNTDKAGRGRLTLLLLLVAVLVRVPLFWLYTPTEWGDTGSYKLLARQLLTQDFSGYLPKRTPGYPLLLLLVGSDDMRVWLLQAALGVFTSWLLFDLAWRVTRHAGLSFALGLIYALSLHFLFQEAAILTEALSSFLVVLLFWLVSRYIDRTRPWVNGWLVASGLVLGWLILVRPAMQLLLPIIPLGCWLLERPTLSWAARLTRGATFIGLALVFPVAWMTVNARLTGQFTLSVIGPFTMLNHTGAFIDDAPEKYAVLRDVYLKYRAQQMAQIGVQNNTFVRALPEWEERTNLSYLELSKVCQDLSRDLIRAHPWLYVRSVLKGWINYWKCPNLWHPQEIRFSMVRAPAQAVWAVQRWILVIANGVFLLLAVLRVGRVVICRDWSFSWIEFWMGAALAASVAQSLVNCETSGRYATPLQPLVLLVVAISLWRFRNCRPRAAQSI